MLSACHPVVENSSDRLSPDFRWTATLELVDNGLGFGQGMLFDEVHVSHPHAWRFLWGHGEPDKSVVFYVYSDDTPRHKPVLRWADAHHLVIQYSGQYEPGRQLTRFSEVTITYKTF
jgi:hypothetical protein